MKTLAGVEALPPQESQKSQSASEVEVEPRPALPAGWETVRTESSGEILFLHQESLRCQRERPREPDLRGNVDLPRSSLNLQDVRPPGSPSSQNPRKDLLERHLEDQINFQRDQERLQAQADTEDLIDDLNNIGRKEPVATVSPTKQRKTRSSKRKLEERTNKDGEAREKKGGRKGK